jgi:hypothetical protein
MARCPLLHSVRRNHDPAAGETTLTLVGYQYGTDETAVCGETVVESDGRYAEAVDALVLARAHLGERQTVVWQGRGWTVEYSGHLFQTTA